MNYSDNFPLVLRDRLWQMYQADIYYCGGFVRDFAMNTKHSDIDMIVFSRNEITLHNIVEILRGLEKHARVCETSREPFVQFSHNGDTYQITLTKNDMAVDAMRRDFTINAMYMEVGTFKILDYANGMEDIESRILRPTGTEFLQDPNRVLRAWSFIGRYGFKPSHTLVRYAMRLLNSINDVPREVWGTEFMKLINSKHINDAMLFLHDSGWDVATPFWREQYGYDQNNPHHLENLWQHTMMVAEQATKFGPKHVAAALFHDTGKPATRNIKENGYANYHGHEEVSAKIADETLKNWGIEHRFVDSVVELIREHMSLYGEINNRSLRRLSSRMSFNTLYDVLNFADADKKGRLPVGNVLDIADKIDEFIKLESEKFIPLLTGKDVISYGVDPGPGVGKILEAAKNAQINGFFDTREGALKWLSHYLEKNLGKSSRVRVYMDITHDDVKMLLISAGREPTEENVREMKANLRMAVCNYFTFERVKDALLH